MDNQGNWLQPHEGRIVSRYNRAGFCQVSVSEGDRTAIAYHSANSGDYVIYAVDTFTGFGIFDYYDPPDSMDYRCYWPYFTIDRGGNIHMVVTEYNPAPVSPKTIGYTRSSNGGVSWEDLVPVDTLMTISAVIVSSPVSEKVAIAYCHPIDTTEQWVEDIYYIQSVDGITWNWDLDKVNVTDYSDGGSLFANHDLDAIYDYDDNLHLIWSAQYTGTVSVLRRFLYHYDLRSAVITEINRSDSTWVPSCNFYDRVSPLSRMSLGLQETSNNLYAVYIDVNPFNCSARDYANGVLNMQWSFDGGLSWSEPENLTNSHSPDCQPGLCDSDVWPSLADKVTDYLHIFYFNDLSGGGDWYGDNPALYLAYPTPTTAISNNVLMPNQTSLQNHPNPFNAATTISYSLPEQGEVVISIYNLLGQRVTTIFEGMQEPGEHTITWDASNFPSGVYFARLEAGEHSENIKMVLLK